MVEKKIKINRNRPIGIFDSGIGGLTVLREIIKTLPNENTIYLGDTARVPYGIRSPETVIRYSFENTQFLISKHIKFLVVACNTSSSISLDVIKRAISIPIIGVIEPGAVAAIKATKNKRIGIIGTYATINSSSYTKVIEALDKSIKVFELPCPLFVPLVEEGWTGGDIVINIAKRYLHNLKKKDIDTLILGCTHYPLLKSVISRVMGKGVRLIDSAIETSNKIKKILESMDIFRNEQKAPVRKFYVTDSPERFLDVGERFLGHRIRHIKKISLGI